MNYLRNCRFNLTILLMLSFPLVAMSAEREELYRLGVTADKNKDCIHTIKYLYAFYIINEKSLGDHSKLKISLEQKISRCSSQLKRKLALYEQLSSVKTKKTDGGIIAIGHEIQDPLKDKSAKEKPIILNRVKNVNN